MLRQKKPKRRLKRKPKRKPNKSVKLKRLDKRLKLNERLPRPRKSQKKRKRGSSKP